MHALYKAKDDGKGELDGVKKEVEQAVNTVSKGTRDTAMDLHKLRGELSEFAGKLEESTEQLKAIEGKFKNH